jgi:hypothetical protein
MIAGRLSSNLEKLDKWILREGVEDLLLMHRSGGDLSREESNRFMRQEVQRRATMLKVSLSRDELAALEPGFMEQLVDLNGESAGNAEFRNRLEWFKLQRSRRRRMGGRR